MASASSELGFVLSDCWLQSTWHIMKAAATWEDEGAVCFTPLSLLKDLISKCLSHITDQAGG